MKDFWLGRKIGTAAIGLIANVVAAGAALAANAGSCYAISDPDSRTWCLAKAHREPSSCYAIQRANIRAQCLAET
jgi:hypothetical protein